MSIAPGLLYVRHEDCEREVAKARQDALNIFLESANEILKDMPDLLARIREAAEAKRNRSAEDI